MSHFTTLRAKRATFTFEKSVRSEKRALEKSLRSVKRALEIKNLARFARDIVK